MDELSTAQEKLINSLHTKKGREKSGLCLLEGRKVIETAGDAVEFTFSREFTHHYDLLMTTDTPQDHAAVARIPQWTTKDVEVPSILVVLDGVQDPGNVGSIFRLCLGFDASLLLIESVDVSNPKVVRSSVGALFHVPWATMTRSEAEMYLSTLHRPVFRLELTNGQSEQLDAVPVKESIVLIAGSEGNGIFIKTAGTSIAIDHNNKLESLNVAHALAIALHHIHSSTK